mmetsp:Transcript_34005/g.76546  ORF Transcript_34005/g.76546 Transcript_34005/m.76546 type:complete len:306 (-) Transcript_34005:430-1347(-)
MNSDVDRPQMAASESMSAALFEEFHDMLVDELPLRPPISRPGYDVTLQVKDGATPARLRPYRLPLQLQEELKKTIDFLLQRKIIEKNPQAAWQAPLLFVKKGVDREGRPVFRMCVDYRRLNSALVDDNFLPPVPHEVIERIGRRLANIAPSDRLLFSKLDLTSGFWQLKLSEESKPLTGFVTENEIYQFTALPFGLKVATSAFQKFTQGILQDLSDVLVYVDDVLIFTVGTVEHHDAAVRRVLDRLRQHEVYVKRSKCAFFQSAISFLGYRLSRDGVSPAPSVPRIGELLSSFCQEFCCHCVSVN